MKTRKKKMNMQVLPTWYKIDPLPQRMTASNANDRCTYYAANDLCGPITLREFKNQFCADQDVTSVDWYAFASTIAAPRLHGFIAERTANPTKLLRKWFTPGTPEHNTLVGGIMSIPSGSSETNMHAIAFHRHPEGIVVFDSSLPNPFVVRVQRDSLLKPGPPVFWATATIMALIQNTPPEITHTPVKEEVDLISD
jgi:hypothetical protein